MEVGFTNGIMCVNRKTQMVNLNELIDIGNAYRKEEGMREVGIEDYLRRKETWEFIKVLDSKYGKFPELEFDDKGRVEYSNAVKQTDLIVSKRGRYGGTYGNLYIALDIATWINPTFKLEVYKTFVEKKIIEIRNEGCESFKLLNKTLASKIEGVDEFDYRVIAKAINKKVNGKFIEGWNHMYADADKQKERDGLLKKCIMLLNLDIVKSVEQLIGYINMM